jgi:tetratricopeptide (TPR) repeat protein
MKYFFIYGLSLALVMFYVQNRTGSDGIALRKQIELRKENATGCSPLRDKYWSPADIPLLPGTGTHNWKISTTNDSAQVYFNQGMNLYFSFHIIESLGSFLKAEQFDPENGILYWAEALSYGPNINDVGYAASPGVFPALEKAAKFSNALTPIEKDLITALGKRYSSDTSRHQDKLNIDYRDAMSALYKKYPGQPEIIALYADALMLIHPWDLYDHDHKPKPWTGELIGVLENGLKISPNHPGINHYYIHAVEASATPGRALSSAGKLGLIAPNVSHMVHMPSHIYIRTGNYDEGIKVNAQSLNGYDQYLQLYPSVVNNAWLYQFHNIHLLTVCAMMKGDRKEASTRSNELKNNITLDYYAAAPPFREYMYYMAAAPIFSAIRFGQWDELKAMPEIANSASYLKILNEFGKGIAYARTKKMDEATKCLANIDRLMRSDENLKIRFGAFNTAYAGAEVAFAMLGGIIEEEKGNYSSAAEKLERAVMLEENMVYDEPKDWILPPLPYLGQVLLKNRKFADAEKVFKKDLKFNPNNCWSFKGLEMTYSARGNTAAAAKTKAILEKQLKQTGLDLKAPVF